MKRGMRAPDAENITIALGDVSATDAFGLSLELDGQDLIETVYAAGPGIFRARRRSSDGAAGAGGVLLREGAMLGFLQLGPLLFPVAMPGDGWLLATAPDGAAVGHGTALFRILRATGAIIP